MNRVFIIAEAGVNHNGRLDLALKLVDKAVEAKVDCIKFQTFITEEETSRYAEKADYQKNTTEAAESQYEMSKKLELSFDEFVTIKNYCDDKGILFLSTPFDNKSIDFLNDLGMPVWKIPSSDVTNLPYLIKIAKTGKPVILSTGMTSLEEIACAIDVLQKNGTNDITILHCTTEYPAPINEINLLAMKTMYKEFGFPVGYSDHTEGIDIPMIAVAMGAVVIEKHFTLDKDMEGPDHKASLNPEELKEMVSCIRKVEMCLGDGIKQITPSEGKNLYAARKSIVAKRKIEKGEIFTEDNITTKRPGNGISPMRWFDILGRQAIRDFSEDELITL